MLHVVLVRSEDVVHVIEGDNTIVIASLPWPSLLPNLKRIEHLFDELGRSVRNREPAMSNFREHRHALLEVRSQTHETSEFDDQKVSSCFLTEGRLYTNLTRSS